MPSPLPFDDLANFFADEDENGQLCDIVMPAARPRSWIAIFDIIRAGYTYRFSLLQADGGSVPAVLPDNPDPVVAAAGSESGPWPSLNFDLAGITVDVHFFGQDWIELCFDRAAVAPDNYEALAHFMHRLGDAAAQDVFLTPESDLAAAAMVYEAATRRFRRPRRAEDGKGAEDLRLRSSILSAFTAALAPIKDAAPSPRSSGRVLSDDLLSSMLDAISCLRQAHSELVLQDVLSLHERRDIDRAWTLIASIITVSPGVDRTPHHPAYERELIELACSIHRRGSTDLPANRLCH